MDRPFSAPRLCFCVSAGLTALGTVLQTVAMFTCFDTSVGYFNGTFLSYSVKALYLLSVLAPLICMLFTQKATLPNNLSGAGRPYVAIPTGVAFGLFTIITAVLYVMIQKGAIKDPSFQFDSVRWPMILALPASLYFFFTARSSGRLRDNVCLIVLLPIVWSFTAVYQTYADLFTAMNSPIKVSLQLGFFGIMLTLVAEIRFRLGKPAPRVALAVWCMAMFLCFVGGVPCMIASFGGILHNRLHILYALIMLVMGFYTLVQAVAYLWYQPCQAQTNISVDSHRSTFETGCADNADLIDTVDHNDSSAHETIDS